PQDSLSKLLEDFALQLGAAQAHAFGCRARISAARPRGRDTHRRFRPRAVAKRPCVRPLRPEAHPACPPSRARVTATVRAPAASSCRIRRTATHRVPQMVNYALAQCLPAVGARL